jgi:hypothetical protein
MNPGAQCGNPATLCVRVHAFGDCKQPELANGFASQFLCRPCMLVRANTINRLVWESQQMYRSRGVYLQCTTCEASVIRVHEFFDVENL